MHPSSVHMFVSAQFLATCVHCVPPTHWSVVHKSLSSQVPQFTVLEVPQLSFPVIVPQIFPCLVQKAALLSGVQHVDELVHTPLQQ